MQSDEENGHKVSHLVRNLESIIILSVLYNYLPLDGRISVFAEVFCLVSCEEDGDGTNK